MSDFCSKFAAELKICYEINKIQSIVELYAEFFKKQYQLHIGGRIDD